MKTGFCIGLCLCLIFTGPGRAAEGVVRHPSLLKFQTLNWEPPDPAQIRSVMKNGMIVYLREDHSLPVVELTVFCRGGALEQPKSEWGLAQLAATLMRNGGTRSFPADAFNEEAEFLAADLNCAMEITQARASLSVLKKNLNPALRLFGEMLMAPVFDGRKLALFQEQLCQNIRHRWDNPRSVMEIGYNHFVYSGFPCAFLMDSTVIKGFTRQALSEYHAAHFCPNRMILAVSGDFDKAQMLKTLEGLFGKWKNLSKKPPALQSSAPLSPEKPGLYFIQKAATQVNIKMGYRLIQRPHDDYYALSLMNFILGGGGSFTSRIGSLIREREGLAYTVYSEVESNYFYPGTFYVYMGTKSASMSRAVNLARGEIEKFKTTAVAPEELGKARDYYLQSFPTMFRTSADIAQTFAQSEYWGRGMDHFKKYKGELNAITPRRIQEVALKYLDTRRLVIVCAGDSAALADTAGTGAWGHAARLSPEALAHE